MVLDWHLRYIAILHLDLAELVNVLAVHEHSLRYDYY